MRLVGTTKHTLQAIRERTHWNSANLQPMDPVTLGLCSQIDLDFEVNRAAKDRPKVEETAARPWSRPRSRPPARPAPVEPARGVRRAEAEAGEERIDVDSVFGKLKEKEPRSEEKEPHVEE